MIAVDTNLLIYAHRQECSFHAQSLQALLELAEGTRQWGIPWPCVHEFISIVTHPRIYNPPTPMEVALACIDQWMKSPMCHLISEGPGYWEKLKHQALQGKISGPMIHDARIAAICQHNGVTLLWSADRDFSRFSGLKTKNPLHG